MAKEEIEYPHHKVFYKDPFGNIVEVIPIFKAGIPPNFVLCKTLDPEKCELLNLHISSLIFTTNKND